MEAALRLARLKLEEAQHQGTRKAEQRGTKGGCHALERTVDAGLQLGEHLHGIACGDLQAGDGVSHGADRFQQSPESAEQAEEDQQPDHVAGEVTPFVETRGNSVQHRARGHR